MLRNASLIRLFFLLCVLFPGLLSAQWTKTNGLPGGSVGSFIHFGDTVLLNTGRLHFSANHGQSWTPLHDAGGYSAFKLATDGVHLYTQGYQPGLGKAISWSADFGQTWSTTSVPDTFLFYDFFTLPGFVYGADYRGMYRSADHGAHWELVTTQSVSNIQVDGQRIVGNRAGKIIASLDGGFTWNTLLLFTGNVIAMLQDENHLFAFVQNASSNGNCWASNDYGQTWQLFTGFAFDQFYAFVWHDGAIYGLKGRQVFKSTDLGDHWTIMNVTGIGYPAYAGISSGSNILIGGFYTGVLRSTDGGESWFAANQGLDTATPTELSVTNQGLFAPADGIYQLQPDGINWSNMHYNIPFPGTGYSNLYNSFLQAGDYLLAGAGDDASWISIDGGDTWVQSFVPAGGFGGTFTPFGLVGSKVIGLRNSFNGGSVPYISDNNGLSFQPLTSLTTQFGVSGRTFDLDAGQLFALTGSGHLYHSNDGDNWSALPTPIPLDSFNIWGIYGTQLFVRGHSIWVFNGDYAAPKLAFSIDLGQSWVMHDLNTAGFSWGSAAFQDVLQIGNYLLAATDRGIFLSEDGGLQWTAWNEGLVIRNATNLQVYNGYVWASINGDGIWKRSVSELDLQTATGTVFHDQDGNGQQDGGEPGLANVIVQSLTSNTYTNTRADGTFTLLSSLAQEQVKVLLPAPYWTAQPASQTVSLPATGANFALTLDPAARDLSAALTNVAALRPGFEAAYTLSWRNETPLSAPNVAIELVYPPDQLEFISAVPAPASQATGLLKWQPGDVAPNAAGLIQLLFKVPATVALGTKICATATAGPLEGDLSPANNRRERCATVVGAFDPNDKQAEPAAQLTPNAIAAHEPVVYTIRFQNTGNFPATFVRITDTLSAYFDPATFRVVSASHPCTWTLRHAGEVEFDFQNIQLPPETTNEPGSHGFVQYSVQARPDLALGTPLRNTAHLFFDYNAPVTTNTTETVVSLLNPTHSPDKTLIMRVSPNPAADFARLELPAAGLLTVTDALGRLMWQSQTGAGLTELDVRHWPTGAYRLRFKNDAQQGERVLVVQR